MVTIWNAMRPNPRLLFHGLQADRLLSGKNAPVTAQIADFLDGRTNGEGLLHSLYDYVLDEPVPDRMRMLLRES